MALRAQAKKFAPRPGGGERAEIPLYLVQRTGYLPTVCDANGNIVGEVIRIRTDQGVDMMSTVTLDLYVHHGEPPADIAEREAMSWEEGA